MKTLFFVSILMATFININAPAYEKSHTKAYANSQGWNHIADLNRNESIDIEVYGNWRSGRESFDAAGVRHYDSRHPFPNSNAMAMIIRVKYSNQSPKYYTLNSCSYNSSKTFYLHAHKSAEVSWMINDWQRGGLGDNSGYLNLYYEIE